VPRGGGSMDRNSQRITMMSTGIPGVSRTIVVCSYNDLSDDGRHDGPDHIAPLFASMSRIYEPRKERSRKRTLEAGSDTGSKS
jgi:hypothetical protein